MTESSDRPRRQQPLRRSAVCVALLSSVVGCSAAPETGSTLYPVWDERGIVTYRYRASDRPDMEAATPPSAYRPRQPRPDEGERRTTLTAAQLQEQLRYDEERRRLQRERQADEAEERRLLRDQQWEETLQRLRNLQADGGAGRRARAARRQGPRAAWRRPPAGISRAERLEQESQELDRALERLRRSQEQPQ